MKSLNQLQALQNNNEYTPINSDSIGSTAAAVIVPSEKNDSIMFSTQVNTYFIDAAQTNNGKIFSEVVRRAMDLWIESPGLFEKYNPLAEIERLELKTNSIKSLNVRMTSEHRAYFKKVCREREYKLKYVMMQILMYIAHRK